MQVMAGALGPLTRSSAAVQAYRDLIMGTSGLVAYYRLGEASGIVASDETGNYNGSYLPNSGGAWTGGTLGATGAIAGDANTSANFNGTGIVSVTLPTSATNSGSVEAWFNTDLSSGFHTLARCNLYLFRMSTNALEWHFLFGGSASIVKSSITAGWHHTCATWNYVSVTNSTTNTLYFDGALVGSNTVAGATTFTSQAVGIGGRTTFSEMFVGPLDETVFYNTALTSTQVLAHYNKGAGI